MNNLILLLAGLVCAHAAPQFVFVLPPEFLHQIQKPVGEASQSGQQPQIPVFPIESLLGSSSRLAESSVSAPVVPKSLEIIHVVEVQQQQATESAPVVVTELSPINVVSEIALLLAKAQGKVPAVVEAPVEATMVEEASPIVQEAPIVDVLVEEAVPDVQHAPVEALLMEEIITKVQETPVDTPVQEVTSESSINIQNDTPVEEMVAPSIVEKDAEILVAVEEVIIVQDPITNTAEEVIIVEEVIDPITNTAEEIIIVEEVVGPITNTAEEIIIVEEVNPSSTAATTAATTAAATTDATAATTQAPVATTSSPVPTIASAPAANQVVVDPRMSVDPRFRHYIYVNDAPDVVAAKIALFNLQAASLPVQQVI